MNKGGFSWRRLTGVSAAKSRISRKIGIPLTRSGRQRKFGAAMGCCLIPLVSVFIIFMAMIITFICIFSGGII